MKRIKWVGRSPAILATVLALVAAVAGTALDDSEPPAGPETRPTAGRP
jgi:hypothetical protein